MKTCPFCQLVDNRDELLVVGAHSAAFLDVNPIRPGHVLVVPKEHEPDFFNLDDEVHLDIMRLAKRVARAQQRVFSPLRVGLLVAGLDVPHAHMHLIPMHDYHDVTSKRMLEGAVTRAGEGELNEHRLRLSRALRRAG